MQAAAVGADGNTSSYAERFCRIETGHVADALERIGIVTPVLSDAFRPTGRRATFAGPAVTLRLCRARTGKESRRLNEVTDVATFPGSVAVIDAQGMTTAAVFGDRVAMAARRRGAVGAVINGGVRDVVGLDELDFPVHAKGRAIRASEGVFAGLGINDDVVLDGVLVSHRDWIVADESGICVVPHQHLNEVLDLAEEREQVDRESLVDLRAGKSLQDSHRHFKDDDPEYYRATE